MPKHKKSVAKPILRFILIFIVLLIVFSLAFGYLRSHSQNYVQDYINFTAFVVSGILNFLGFKAGLYQATLSLSNFSVEVVLECAAVYQILVFTAAVLAFPATWKKKILGIVIGAPVLYVIDLFRIMGLLLVGNYLPKFFDFTHLYTGQMFVIFVVILLWLLWINKIAFYQRKFS